MRKISAFKLGDADWQALGNKSVSQPALAGVAWCRLVALAEP